jgi:hypothetical protein
MRVMPKTNSHTLTSSYLLAAVLLASCAASRPSSASPHRPVDETLRRALLARAASDQEARAVMTRRLQQGVALDSSVAQAMEVVDTANTTWLKRVVREHGWPRISLVGRDGESAAFLIAQHADRDTAFQASMLPLLERAYASGEAEGQQVALLTDRVATARGMPQSYGTQSLIVDGRVTLKPIADSAGVDARRARLGLRPLREYVRMLESFYTPRSAGSAITSSTTTDTSGAAAVAERWWRAFTLGDTAYLRQHTSRRLTLTLSNGQTFDVDQALRNAATHVPKPSTFVQPATDVAVMPVGDVVVVTSSVREGSQGGSNVYRYLTVLERSDSSWRVAAGHSTRVLASTPRVAASVAGPLGDYVGRYRGQGGGVLQIVARDSTLGMIDPSGGEARLEPIGPALFELPSLYDGIAVVRFSFARDATGRVTSLSRMIYGSVITWPRLP